MNHKAGLLLHCLKSSPGGIAVEVGATRHRQENPAEGHSTLYLAQACRELGRRFYSLELNPATARQANESLIAEGLPACVLTTDACWALRDLSGIGLLYLDGSDDPHETLCQFFSSRFMAYAVVVVDDCHDYGGNSLGKGTHLATWLIREGIPFHLRPTEPGYQSLVTVIPPIPIRIPQS